MIIVTETHREQSIKSVIKFLIHSYKKYVIKFLIHNYKTNAVKRSK